MKKILLILTLTFLPLSSIFSETITVNITDALELLHKNNIDIKLKTFDLLIKKRNKDTAWTEILDFNPYIGLNSNVNCISSERTDPYFSFELDFYASLGIDFSLIEEVKGHTLSYEEGIISYDIKVSDLEYSVKTRFYNLLKMENLLQLEKKDFDLYEKRYKDTEEKYNKNQISETELLRTRLSFEKNQSDIILMNSQYEMMKEDFKLLIGLEREQSIILGGSLESEVYSFDKENIISGYLTKSLDLQSLNKWLEILENWYSGNNLRNYAPNLSVSYSNDDLLSYSSNTSQWSFEDENGINAGTLNISLSLSLDNFLPGFSTDVNRRNEQNRISKKELDIENTVKQKQNEIIDIITELDNLTARTDNNQLRFDLASTIFHKLNNDYNQGNELLVNVENAQNDFIEAEINILNDKYYYLIELLNLENIINTSVEEINSIQ